MDKKSEGHNSEKGAGRNKPDHERGSGKDQLRETGGGNREHTSGASENRQNAGSNREPGADASDYSQKVESKREQDFEKSDYHYRAEADKLADETKKSGCLPKLFMLLVPFAAVGTYFFLRS